MKETRNLILQSNVQSIVKKHKNVVLLNYQGLNHIVPLAIFAEIPTQIRRLKANT